MSNVRVERIESQKVSSVYYKDNFLGFVEDGDHVAMQRLMNQALTSQSQSEKKSWNDLIIKMCKLTYNLDRSELSESKMVEIIKKALV